MAEALDPDDDILIKVLIAGGLQTANLAMRELMACFRAEKLHLSDAATLAAVYALGLSALYNMNPDLTDDDARALFASLFDLRVLQKDLYYDLLVKRAKATGREGQA